jgi:hypothetical protein
LEIRHVKRNAIAPSFVLAAALLVAAAVGCDTLLGGGYTIGSTEAGDAAPADGAPFADVGPDACASDAQTRFQLERACGGNATCARFDNAARNLRCDGGVACPRVPPADAGLDAAPADAEADAAPADAGAADGAAGDADGGGIADATAGDAAGDGRADAAWDRGDAAGDGAAADATENGMGAEDAAPGPVAATDGGTATDGMATDAGPASPSCFALTRGPAGGAFPRPVVYAAGSTAIQPYVARVAQVLESLSIASVVYLGAGSCLGIDAMLDPTRVPLRRLGAAATYYDAALDTNGNVQAGTCTVDDPSRMADVGISDVFPTTCDPQLTSQGGLPNNLHDFFGPVQVMELVVPRTSTQTSISAEAAYMVWGFGSHSGVAPWTDESFLLQRSSTSGTQNMIAATIGLDPAQWRGLHNATSSAVVTAIENVVEMRALDGGPGSSPIAAEMTMGILASDVADSNREYLKPLAFQDVDQTCGWYPDSTPSSFDKKNVRDGHYPIWGPSHLVVYADANGNATNAGARALVDTMNGTDARVLATLDIVQFYAKSHVIPTCAMHVTRTSDGHDYAPYSPPTSCSCYYDLQATGETSCVPCETDADCKSAPNGATTCVDVFGIPPAGHCEPPGSSR